MKRNEEIEGDRLPYKTDIHIDITQIGRMQQKLKSSKRSLANFFSHNWIASLISI